MPSTYVEPPPEVEDVREGDVCEIGGDLFVALEDADAVVEGGHFAREDEDYAVELRGAGEDMRCHLTVRIDENGAREHFLWTHWDHGYKERHQIDGIQRCLRTELSVSTE